MYPIVKKIMGYGVVKVEIATAFCRNTTLTIPHNPMIKIITRGYMHNNQFLQRVKMVLGRLPQSHFAPLGEMSSLRFQ